MSVSMFSSFLPSFLPSFIPSFRYSLIASFLTYIHALLFSLFVLMRGKIFDADVVQLDRQQYHD